MLKGELHGYAAAAMTKEIPIAKGHSRGRPAGCDAFHQASVRGERARGAVTRWPHRSKGRDSGPEPSDHISHKASRFMTECDTKRERGELPHSKLARPSVIKNNFL